MGEDWKSETSPLSPPTTLEPLLTLPLLHMQNACAKNLNGGHARGTNGESLKHAPCKPQDAGPVDSSS
jgi:hypothetical protein